MMATKWFDSFGYFPPPQMHPRDIDRLCRALENEAHHDPIVCQYLRCLREGVIPAVSESDALIGLVKMLVERNRVMSDLATQSYFQQMPMLTLDKDWAKTQKPIEPTPPKRPDCRTRENYGPPLIQKAIEGMAFTNTSEPYRRSGMTMAELKEAHAKLKNIINQPAMAEEQRAQLRKELEPPKDASFIAISADLEAACHHPTKTPTIHILSATDRRSLCGAEKLGEIVCGTGILWEASTCNECRRIAGKPSVEPAAEQIAKDEAFTRDRLRRYNQATWNAASTEATAITKPEIRAGRCPIELSVSARLCQDCKCECAHDATECPHCGMPLPEIVGE